MTLRPHPAVLTIWRFWLFLAALAPAFLMSVFFRIGSGWWLFANACWLAPFLAAWAWYLPQRLHGFRYELSADRLVVRSGVFGRRVKTIPRASVRYTTVAEPPVGRMFGFATLFVAAAGGQAVLPGMRVQDARDWARELLGENPAGD